MVKRNSKQRRHIILRLLAEQGEVSVEHLASHFATSEVTIRKDLSALEKNGLLLRRYGGAITVPEELIQSTMEHSSPNKQRMAQAAANLIRDNNRIIIDSGSTTSALIEKLNDKRGLLVMTNSLSLANAIHELEHEPTLLMTGGTGIPTPNPFKGKSRSRCYAYMILISYLSVPMGLTLRVAQQPLMN